MPTTKEILEAELQDIQSRRMVTLKKSLPFMQVFRTPMEQIFRVINYKTGGNYEVDYEEMTCTCFDAFHVMDRIEANVWCKHILLVAYTLKHQGE